jgi:hypothetical protein
MPIIRTVQEDKALKIKPRNYSSVLSLINFLTKRKMVDYTPKAVVRLNYTASSIGTGAGASKIFNEFSPTSYVKGTPITISGTATYLLSQGANTTLMPATKIVAQIDVSRTTSTYPAYQVEAAATQIETNGNFSFTIPAEITSKLAVGSHSVYVNAASPDNAMIVLTATGGNATNNIRTFAITAQ